MLTFLEPNIEMLFEEHKTVKEMFEAISTIYSSSSDIYVQMLIEKYNSSKMLNSESVVDYRNKMTVIAKALATLGNLIPERMQVSTTLNSLPDYWEQVVIYLNMSLTAVTILFNSII
eukprot:TRINITY_DN8699_c0_g2_i1.p1 TRINITY_DN8699_c0_g2~~TRINITY_DN8699_c0_g2_i1.p1  ORF type:complete len:117 (-),score=8.83 TRINITY_DN8699_c0_g2_i1:1041-1391(-)